MSRETKCWKGKGWLIESLYHSLRNLDLILETMENFVEGAMVIFRFEIIHLDDSVKDRFKGDY